MERDTVPLRYRGGLPYEYDSVRRAGSGGSIQCGGRDRGSLHTNSRRSGGSGWRFEQRRGGASGVFNSTQIMLGEQVAQYVLDHNFQRVSSGHA